MSTSEHELKELMTAGLDGDAAAHRALLERLSRHLRGYYRLRLSSVGRGPSEAEDLLQEALMAIHTRRHTYDRTQLFTPWVHAIARYKLIDYLRRTRVVGRNVPIDDANDVVSASHPSDVESSIDLQRLLSRLPHQMRQAIQDVKLTGFSVAETAHRTGMSESAVKVNIHRGLRALSAAIASEGKS